MKTIISCLALVVFLCALVTICYPWVVNTSSEAMEKILNIGGIILLISFVLGLVWAVSLVLS